MTVVPEGAGPEVERRLATAVERVGAAEEAWRRHEVANARTAIEGADAVLATDSVSDADRAFISRLRASGQARLAALDAGEGPAPGPVSLHQAARDAIDALGWAGGVTLDVDSGLLAAGAAAVVTEALRQLLSCAPELCGTVATGLHGRRTAGAVEVWLDPPVPVAPVPGALPVGAQVAARLLGGAGEVVTEDGDGRVALGIRVPAADSPREPA